MTQAKTSPDLSSYIKLVLHPRGLLEGRLHFSVSAGLLLATVGGCSVETGEFSQITQQSCSSDQVPFSLADDTRFYVPPAPSGAEAQIKTLKKQGMKAEARLIKKMVKTPQAVWLGKGSPTDVEEQARKIVRAAAKEGTVPVLVAYNLPFRDCSQFSAGGATTKTEYQAWIDGVVAGIGDLPAVVIVEPDGLGIIPFYNPFSNRDNWLNDGIGPKTRNELEWCQPAEAIDGVARLTEDEVLAGLQEQPAMDRFDMLSYAVSALKTNANARVYLDGTHEGWLGAGDAADRLIQANVAEADGFFLNVSNYRADERLKKYGTWIAQCTWYASEGPDWAAGHTEWCGSQYSPATPDDFSTWTLTDEKYAADVESQPGYPGDQGLKHFVVDSGRNGAGPWSLADAPGDIQDWCNAPDRGLGLRPSAATGSELIDAYLWIKPPGESDGECNRWEPAGSPDPVRGMMDPPAGFWFPEMALELVTHANPEL